MKLILNRLLRKLILGVALFIIYEITACTTITCTDIHGQIWNMNNEDGPFKTATFINVYPKQEGQPIGYYTLTYLSPRYGQSSQLQGGMNEKGLTFDFNAIDHIADFDHSSKKRFELGDEAVLAHILGTMQSVDEVVAFFDQYWFSNGFVRAQMHVADASGSRAIISASGVICKKNEHLISTNFNLAAGAYDEDCWRYEAANQKLQDPVNGVETMKDLADATRQKNGRTMYTNIQNLSTGQLWFASQEFPNVYIATSLSSLLSQGQRSYPIAQLASIKDVNAGKIYPTEDFDKTQHLDEQVYAGGYYNEATGVVAVSYADNQLKITFVDGERLILRPIGNRTFSMDQEQVYVRFEENGDGIWDLHFFENNYWAFTATLS